MVIQPIYFTIVSFVVICCCGWERIKPFWRKKLEKPRQLPRLKIEAVFTSQKIVEMSRSGMIGLSGWMVRY